MATCTEKEVSIIAESSNMNFGCAMIVYFCSSDQAGGQHGAEEIVAILEHFSDENITCWVVIMNHKFETLM